MIHLEHSAEAVTSINLQLFAEDDKKDDVLDDKKVDDKKPDDRKVDAEYASRLRREAENERKAREAVEKDRDELRKYREDRERKDLEEQKEFQKLADKERKLREDAEAKHKEELSARDKRYIRAEVRAAAIKAGILDTDDVNAMDISDLRMDDAGNVIGVDEFVKAQAEKKPHWFKAADEADDKSKQPPASKPKGTDKSKPFDAAKMDDKEWAAYKKRMLTGAA